MSKNVAGKVVLSLSLINGLTKKWKNIPLKNGGFENTSFEKVSFNNNTFDQKRLLAEWALFPI